MFNLIRRILPVFILSIGASGCSSNPTIPDKYGYIWFKERDACTRVSVNRVADYNIPVNCPIGMLACTIRKRDLCIVFIPNNDTGNIYEHEMKHVDGWNHQRKFHERGIQ